MAGSELSVSSIGALLGISQRLVPLCEAGAGLSRVMQHLTDGRPFLLLTAYRAEYSEKENRQRNAKLAKDFVAAGLGGVQVQGVWTDTETGEEARERSFLLTDRPGAAPEGADAQEATPSDLLQFGLRMARKYDQQAVLFGDGKQVVLIFPHGASSYKRVKIASQPSLSKEALDGAMASTDIKGRKFVFEGYASPASALGAMALSKVNLAGWFDR